jgi:hypothetical protein
MSQNFSKKNVGIYNFLIFMRINVENISFASNTCTSNYRKRCDGTSASLWKTKTSGIQPFFFVRIPPDVFSLELCTLKLLVYKSRYTQPIIYI